MTVILKNPDQSMLEKVAEEMKAGKNCIYPTETCYGLGTNATDEDAVKKIHGLKSRPEEKKLSCVVSSLDIADKYCNLTERERKLSEEFMPGPFTLVVQKKDSIPDILNDKFVFRIPSNETAKKLSSLAGVPLVSTSANLSGAPNPYSIKDISRLVKDSVDYILDSGELEEGEPSTIVEIEEGELKIHREGPVPREKIERFLSL